MLDFNPACINGLQASASHNYSLFKSESTEVIGISTNVIFSQKAFVDLAKINYPLLSDRGGRMLRAYGVYDETKRAAKRAYVIIDKEGVIRYLNIRPTYTENDLLSTEDLLTEVKKVNKR